MFMLEKQLKAKAAGSAKALPDIPAPGPDAGIVERAKYKVKVFLRNNYHDKKAWDINVKLAMNSAGFVGAIVAFNLYGDQLMV